MTQIRTRFAPSPTGFLHVGGLRTALYAYLFAKKNNGQFLLRIEDTDQKREVAGAVENLIATLKWAGLDYDEGPIKNGPCAPYIQSQRLDLYKKHAQELIEKGHAYYCFCTPERLEQVRQKLTEAKLPPAYDKHCRNLDIQESLKRIEAGEKYVIRMKVPLEGEITFYDIVRGDITFSFNNVDDQVLIKSDGFPTYHLAVVVDDHYMKVSHVIRGEEWLSSTPKHILLYKYFGWAIPQMAHLPLLLNPDKSKLSKRQGDVAVEDYRDKGYLKEAIINFIALLGWNPGDTREIFSLQELIQEFTLERVGKSGAIFNVEKLNWLNQQHLRLKTDQELLDLVKPIIINTYGDNYTNEYILSIINLIKDRAVFAKDFISECPFFYKAPETFDLKSKEKNWTEQTPVYLKELAYEFSKLEILTAQNSEQILRNIAERLVINAGKLIHPLRLALTGVSIGPSLFHLIEVLGKEKVLNRIDFAIKNI